MAHVSQTVKEIFDLIEGLPGLAAFIKVFFGSEAGQKKMEERLFKDLRDELFDDIRLLGTGHRENLVRRFHEAELFGKEDGLVWNLCKIKREVRRETLKWLNSLDDHEFKVMADLLDDDKFRQFFVRMTHLIKEQLVPSVRAATETTISATKEGLPKIKEQLVEIDQQVARKFNRFADWLDS